MNEKGDDKSSSSSSSSSPPTFTNVKSQSVKQRQYNPYILGLLYPKAFYLNRLLTIHLTWCLPGALVDEREKRLNDIKLMRFLIEKEYYVKSIIDDIESLENLLPEHKYKFDLYYANFEFALYRLWLFSITGLDQSVKGETTRNTTYYTSLSREFDDTQFQCEIHLCAHLGNDNGDKRPQFHSLIERYIEDFYFNPSGYNEKRVKSRMKQFFDIKRAVEKAFYERYYQSSSNQDASTTLLFEHTKESIMSIIYMYIINEFIHYSRHDTRQSWLNDKFTMTKGGTTTYNPEEGKDNSSNGGGGDGSDTSSSSLYESLKSLQEKLFNIVLSHLQGNIEVKPLTKVNDNQLVTIDSENMKMRKNKKKKTSSHIAFSKLVINESDSSFNDIDQTIYDEVEKDEFYYTRNIDKMPKNVLSLIVNHQERRQFNQFLSSSNGNDIINECSGGGSDNNESISLIPLKERSYYETILRVFFFDIKMAECHSCKVVTKCGGGGRSEENDGGINHHHETTTTTFSSRMKEIFGCFICRYQYERITYRSFYNSMDKLNYHKKLTSSMTLTNRSQLSICLSFINLNEIEPSKGYIYKLLYITYLILYHTPIVSSQLMQKMLLSTPLSISKKVNIPAYDNIFAFMDIKEIVNHLEQSNKSQTEISQEISSILKGETENVTSEMIGIVDEMRLLRNMTIKVIPTQQENIEKYERSKYMDSSTVISDTHDDIIKCLHTIYSYYDYILTNMKMNNK